MEVTKKGKFITANCGTQPAVGSQGILERWVQDKQDDALMSFGEQIKKKGENSMDALQKILSVFHRDLDGNPIIGNWMLQRCLIVTAQALFNAMRDKSHPKKAVIPMAITLIEPINITMQNNGKLIKEPDGVRTHTVSLINGRSFFKAYEYINAGATFETTIHFDDELFSEDNIKTVLDKCGSIGLGAYRARFGKFVWID